MARPKSKEELVIASQTNYKKLVAFVNTLDSVSKNKEFPKGSLNKNVRDVLAHLHQWHLMMIGWYTVGMRGDKPDMSATGYTWRTVPDLNREIQKQYSLISLDQILIDLQSSFEQIQKLIKTHSDKELFTKKMHPWTGSTSLGAYFISATSSHYDWGLKLIKKALNAKR